MSMLEEVDPKQEILLLKGSALEKFAMHPVYGKMTSHEILECLQREYVRQGGRKVQEATRSWVGGPSQMNIMVHLEMFEATDFTRVKFVDLSHKQYTVWTYCWADSPWGAMWSAVKGVDSMVHRDCHWFDIFCLDQFKPNKMETIIRSNHIYGDAKKYFVLGMACFSRLWCCAELGCKDHHQIRLVSEFGSWTERGNYLGRREQAYKDVSLLKDCKFDDCRCSEPTDRDVVRKRILEKFDRLESFDVQIQGVANDVLRPFRDLHNLLMVRCRSAFGGVYAFAATDDEPDKCWKCGKSEGRHHGHTRLCYDFLQD